MRTPLSRFCLGADVLPVLPILLVLLTALLAGCSFERADPAARSNRTTYGAISLVASGDGSSCSLTIGDGTIASADGEGAITQPARQSAEQSPDITVPGDAVSAGISAVGHVAGKAIDAYAASKSSGASGTTGECADGSCSTGTDCADGSCTDSSTCTDCEAK